MSLLLSIETSGPTGSVALVKDGKCLGTNVIYKSFSHSATLGLVCQQLLENLGLQIHELEAVAVSDGPGSFTGLRIGASYAKGLCFGLGIPLIPVATHLAMANQVLPFLPENAIVVSMQDARRMEVYQTIYQWQNNELKEVEPCTNHVIDETSYAHYLGKNVCYFIGDGALKLQTLMGISNFEKSVTFWPNLVPLAETIGMIGAQWYDKKPLSRTDVTSYTPFYLKPWIGQQPVKAPGNK